MRSETGTDRPRWVLVLILALGAALFVQGAARLPCISRDGVFFVEFAEKLRTEPLVQLRGQTKQPGYSILMLAVHSCLGGALSENAARSWERSGQILAVLGGVAVVGLIYVLTRRLFDARTGLVAAMLAAFWPQLVSLSSDVLSDAPHLAFYLAGLLLGLGIGDRTRHDGRMRWVALMACGTVCGAGYWLRQEALGAVAAVVVCQLLPTAGGTMRRRTLRAGVVATAFVVVVAPYSIAVGKVMPNKSIRDLLFGTEEERIVVTTEQQNDAGPMADRESRIAKSTAHQAGPVRWWDAPVKMLGGWGRSGRYVLSTLALVGFFWRAVPRSELTARRLVMMAAMFQLLAAQARGMAYGVVSDRYLLIPAGLSIPWAAAGLLAIARHRPGSTGLRLTIAALIAVAPMAYYDLAPAPPGASWQREAGEWIAEHAAAGDVVFAAPQQSPVAFYAGLERQWPVGEPIGEALRKAGSVWVVDDPAMSRMTDEEKKMVAALRAESGPRERIESWSPTTPSGVSVYRMTHP